MASHIPGRSWFLRHSQVSAERLSPGELFAFLVDPSPPSSESVSSLRQQKAVTTCSPPETELAINIPRVWLPERAEWGNSRGGILEFRTV